MHFLRKLNAFIGLGAITGWLLPLPSLATEPSPTATPALKSITIGGMTADPQSLTLLADVPHSDVKLLNIQVSDPLVFIDKEGKIQPGLALKWEKVGPDQLKVHLRPGVVFHNGEPCDAKAIQFSIAELLKTGNMNLRTYLGSVKDSFLDPSDPLGLTIVFHKLAAPSIRSLNYALAIPPLYFKEKGRLYFDQHPIGTGPFEFVEWIPGRQIVFKKNPKYWDPERPKVDLLKFRIAPQSQAFSDLKEGRVDIQIRMDGRNTLALLESSNRFKIKKRLVLLQNAVLLRNTGPLASKEVRQALNFALNKKEMIQFAEKGNAVELNSLAAIGSIGRNPDLKPYPFDPERAKAMLKKAGFPKGFKLEGVVLEEAKVLGQILKDQLSKVGVQLNLHEIAGLASYFKNRGAFDGIQIAVLRYANSQVDFSHLAAALFREHDTGDAILRDPVFDQMLDTAINTEDEADYLKRLMALDTYAHDEAISLFTIQRIMTIGARKNIEFEIPVSGSYNTSTLLSEIDVK